MYIKCTFFLSILLALNLVEAQVLPPGSIQCQASFEGLVTIHYGGLIKPNTIVTGGFEFIVDPSNGVVKGPGWKEYPVLSGSISMASPESAAIALDYIYVRNQYNGVNDQIILATKLATSGTTIGGYDQSVIPGADHTAFKPLSLNFIHNAKPDLLTNLDIPLDPNTWEAFATRAWQLWQAPNWPHSAIIYLDPISVNCEQ